LLRGGDRVDRALASHHGPRSAPGPPVAGHVPGRLVPDVPGCPHRDRRLPLRPRPRRPRPPHPPGGGPEPLSVNEGRRGPGGAGVPPPDGREVPRAAGPRRRGETNERPGAGERGAPPPPSGWEGAGGSGGS